MDVIQKSKLYLNLLFFLFYKFKIFKCLYLLNHQSFEYLKILAVVYLYHNYNMLVS